MDIVNMCREISCIYTSLCHQVVFELCFAKYLLSSKYFHYFLTKNSAIKVVKCLETLLCCVDYHGRKTRKFVYGDGSFFEKDLSDFLPMISKQNLNYILHIVFHLLACFSAAIPFEQA